jgi:hypothetical protein
MCPKHRLNFPAVLSLYVGYEAIDDIGDQPDADG